MRQSQNRSACIPGSAWDTWRKVGAKYKSSPIEIIYAAAEAFASEPGWPSAAHPSRYQAFIEGALG